MPIVPEVIIRRRLTAIVCAAMPLAMRTAGRLLAFMIPLSLAVTLLDYTGVLPSIASRLHPVMRVVVCWRGGCCGVDCRWAEYLFRHRRHADHDPDRA